MNFQALWLKTCFIFDNHYLKCLLHYPSTFYKSFLHPVEILDYLILTAMSLLILIYSLICKNAIISDSYSNCS